MTKLAHKLAITATAAVAFVAVAAANAQETGIGAAISNTAGAAYQKSAEGVNAVKGSYHSSMADSNADSAKKNLANGDLGSAATDAKDAAAHKAEAVKANTKASVNKSKAHKDWTKAKAALSTSSTSPTSN